LEYYRVLNLVEGGMGVAEAKKQAQKEILAAFGIDADGFKDSEDMSIFGTGESDAALLAISILLQGDLSEGEFSQRLTSFSQAIRDGGTPSDEVMEAMADWSILTSHGLGIRNLILEWGLSDEVPNFEKYMYAYWTLKYELGVCDEETYGSMKYYPDKNWILAYTGVGGVVCKENGWELAKSDADRFCSISERCDGLFIDARDGNKYRTATIGDENIVWMVDPLKYTDNGIDRYGYNSERALTACPIGWRLPNDQDVEALVSFLNSKMDMNKCVYITFESWLNDNSMFRTMWCRFEQPALFEKFTTPCPASVSSDPDWWCCVQGESTEQKRGSSSVRCVKN